ncbi:MAG: LppP/LprE family lipoprotein [Mycobacterium sp.]|nr:LppP/LprE family lipoprotein [Mycobacterium sp.]
MPGPARQTAAPADPRTRPPGTGRTHRHRPIRHRRRTRLFHRGTFLGTGTVKDYSFITLNRAASTNNAVVLNYKDGRNVCTACPGPITTVRYQWQGDHVAMLDPAPPW